MRPAASFSFPTATIFGPGSLPELPKRLGEIHSRRPLVVTDPGLLPTRAFESLRAVLGKNQLGETWELFHGVHTNPTEQDVIDAAAAYRQGRCDAVVAFGGGSALDVAKALRLLVKKPDLKLAKFNFDDDWSGLPRCIAIPTTAGTGSEVGRSSVITVAGTHRRSVIFHPKLLAKLVILDPEVTRDLPPKLTAATGLDALTHCIESFTSPVVHPLCDGIALEGVHLIVEALPVAFRDGANLDARGKMLLAASMGGVAFQKDLGATHSLAHPLSALCGLHHGTANALCLPHVMAFNAQRQPGVYRRVGIACGLEVGKLAPADADRATIEFLRKFVTDLGLSGGLRGQGVKETQFDGLVAQAFEDPCHATNPVPLKFEDFRALYQAAM
jgi:alcohol dehydrogenase class IV